MPATTPALIVWALLLLGAGRVGHGYEDGAPPGHTGGFGEPDCRACHTDSDPNPADGRLKVSGFPDRVVADAHYELEIVLQHAELRSSGFQLALRSPDGKPAGKLVSLSSRTRLIEETGQVYLQHTKDGLQPENDGTARWVFRWIATGVVGPVYLHVAANAANDDVSPLGDYIFTLERIAGSGRGRDQSSACPVDSGVAESVAAVSFASSGSCSLPFRALTGSSRKR